MGGGYDVTFGVVQSENPNDDPVYANVATGMGVLISGFNDEYTGEWTELCYSGGDWICVCTQEEYDSYGAEELFWLPEGGETNCWSDECTQMCPTPSPI